ncbi:RNAse P Rpr2/Rpp21/SNM1 subunit domain-containing protein [Syncephalis plumigaleata]|nr:RNAse P Rpr2/Rpp21/SNM1 subunit domain-containing protein [Syncephalis plumigaleata]
MGKPKKEKHARQLQNAEEFQRMNFLYQAAALMTAATTGRSRSSSDIPPCNRSKRKTAKSRPHPSPATRQRLGNVNDPTHPPLAGLGRFYVSSLRTVARRNVLRIDPTLKRSLCRRCDSLLLPGVNANIRVEETANPAVITDCCFCKTGRRLPLQPDKQLFCEKPENYEMIELS